MLLLKHTIVPELPHSSILSITQSSVFSRTAQRHDLGFRFSLASRTHTSLDTRRTPLLQLRRSMSRKSGVEVPGASVRLSLPFRDFPISNTSKSGAPDSERSGLEVFIPALERPGNNGRNMRSSSLSSSDVAISSRMSGLPCTSNCGCFINAFGWKMGALGKILPCT